MPNSEEEKTRPDHSERGKKRKTRTKRNSITISLFGIEITHRWTKKIPIEDDKGDEKN